ncbi:hypothetical protein [Fodinicola acaciae]|uniref:hypothetical protein n=1 Tax=Fodinicola acaciae TaxID=2681555 RepID=UPI0013D00F1A|nr:hypothetical protein [Fodinicola acaciae]
MADGVTLVKTPEVRPEDDKSAPRQWVRQRIDVLVCVAYVLCAGYLTAGLWQGGPDNRTLSVNPNDQILIEWFMARASRFWVGDFSLVTDRLNAPEGINLMSNAAHILHGILLAPVIAVAGVATAFALCVALNLAGTAIGWFFLFSRVSRIGWMSAAVGAAVCGFGPAMITQSNSHLHITAQWLVPPIIYCVVRIFRGQRPLITGVVLGVLVASQAFLGEEILFLAALSLVVFSLAYAAFRRNDVRKALPDLVRGLSVAMAVGALLLAYPLTIQFAGPQAVRHLEWSVAYVADLRSYVAFPPLSVAGGGLPAPYDVGKLALGPTEYNTFLGWPLVLLVAVLVGWLWRRRGGVVPAVAVTGIVMVLLSFGPRLVIDGHNTGIWMPYELIKGLPAVDGALPTRYAIVLLPLIGLLVALALDRTFEGRFTTVAVPVAVTVALIPLVPLPLPTAARQPVPTYFASGDWQQCAAPGQTIVTVPLPEPGDPLAMRWAAATDTRFALPQGFFVGPYGAHGTAAFGVYPTSTSQLLTKVRKSGVVPPIGAKERTQAERDLRYWKSSCVVLGPDPRQAELRAALQALFGPGKPVDDVWVWKL